MVPGEPISPEGETKAPLTPAMLAVEMIALFRPAALSKLTPVADQKINCSVIAAEVKS